MKRLWQNDHRHHATMPALGVQNSTAVSIATQLDAREQNRRRLIRSAGSYC